MFALVCVRVRARLMRSVALLMLWIVYVPNTVSRVQKKV
jgi:hypothetical protein